MLILMILAAWFVISIPAALVCGAALHRTSAPALANSARWEPALRRGHQPAA